MRDRILEGLRSGRAAEGLNAGVSRCGQLLSQTTEAPDGTGGSGSGSATLTIGSESWTVDNVSCAFSPEDAGNDRISFQMSGLTETADGVRVQLDATIQDTEERGRYEGDGVIHIVTIADIGDFENPAVGWSVMKGMFGGSVDVIQVDGKSVTAGERFDKPSPSTRSRRQPGSGI